jgi:hypothetical protein
MSPTVRLAKISANPRIVKFKNSDPGMYFTNRLMIMKLIEEQHHIVIITTRAMAVSP